jgi:hypothetical protein
MARRVDRDRGEAVVLVVAEPLLLVALGPPDLVAGVVEEESLG